MYCEHDYEVFNETVHMVSVIGKHCWPKGEDGEVARTLLADYLTFVGYRYDNDKLGPARQVALVDYGNLARTKYGHKARTVAELVDALNGAGVKYFRQHPYRMEDVSVLYAVRLDADYRCEAEIERRRYYSLILDYDGYVYLVYRTIQDVLRDDD